MMTLGRRRFLQATAIGLAGVLVLVARRVYLSERPVPPPRGVEAPVTWPGFAVFAEAVRTSADDQYLLVESNGMPDHPMMIGIRSWQQQVPLPQPYVGDNAWRIPLHGVVAEHPTSARTGLYRGAIALAVNGVPIFNALKDHGIDVYLAGELDRWGGHAGRADDYHYHTAPLHLQATAGPGAPIGFALDGFPLYGLEEPDGSPSRPLDELNGHADPVDGYHYHATPTYPYINGGLRGMVSVHNDQIEPQPRTTPIRPSLTPLRGASVTDFRIVGPDSYSLEYRIADAPYLVNYRHEGRAYTFDFVSPDGRTRTETYRERG